MGRDLRRSRRSRRAAGSTAPACRPDAGTPPLKGAHRLAIPGRRSAPPPKMTPPVATSRPGTAEPKLGNFTSAQMGKIHSALTAAALDNDPFAIYAELATTAAA